MSAARAGIPAIIPARGGSRRLPRKNLCLVGGKSLVARAIAAALGCPRIGRVLVSTDDPEIARVSREQGAEIIDRPARLAGDRSTSEDVTLHALAQAFPGTDVPEHFVLLQPTSPLRTSRHLDECLARYLDAGVDSALSVSPPGSNAHKAMQLVGDRLLPLWQPAGPAQVCLQNGAIYVARTKRFIAEKRFLLEPALAYVMDPESSIDIDTALDLALCNQLLTRRVRGDEADGGGRRP